MLKATITNASQPQNAFFRCLLLQRAIRAARLCADGCESIRFPSHYVGGAGPQGRSGTGTGANDTTTPQRACIATPNDLGTSLSWDRCPRAVSSARTRPGTP